MQIWKMKRTLIALATLAGFAVAGLALVGISDRIGSTLPAPLGQLSSQGTSPRWQDEALLVSLTREGIDNGNFGLQGRLVSAMRAEDAILGEMPFIELEKWVEENVKWEVHPVDRNRSTDGAVAVVPVLAKGHGHTGHEYEQVSVAMPFIVLYGVGGEFPGVMGYKEDGAPFIVHGIFENKYDWREARCEGLRC